MRETPENNRDILIPPKERGICPEKPFVRGADAVAVARGAGAGEKYFYGHGVQIMKRLDKKRLDKLTLRTKVHMQSRQITRELDRPEPDFWLIGRSAVRIAEICAPVADMARKRRDETFAKFLSDKPLPTHSYTGTEHLTRAQVRVRQSELREKIALLRQQGLTQHKIADACGISQTRVSSILRSLASGAQP